MFTLFKPRAPTRDHRKMAGTFRYRGVSHTFDEPVSVWQALKALSDKADQESATEVPPKQARG
jgi:hypothetical protein